MATDYFLNTSLQHNRLLFFSNVCVCVYILAHILHIYIMYILGGGDTCPISLVNSTAELVGVDVCSMSILLYTFLLMICSHIYILAQILVIGIKMLKTPDIKGLWIRLYHLKQMVIPP